MGDLYQTNDANFNQAIAAHMRLDNALRTCQRESMTENFSGWLKAIEMFHRELYPWFNKGEQEEAQKLLSQARLGVKSRNASIELKRDKLGEAERYLRTIFHDRGLDIPRKLDARRSLLQ